jgi:hypothetical protein
MLPLRELGIRQSKAELITFHVDGTGTAAITEGKYHGTLTDNNTGDYTITLVNPSLREIMVVGWATETTGLIPSVVKSASALQIVWTTASGAVATDCNFDVTIIAFYRSEQN